MSRHLSIVLVGFLLACGASKPGGGGDDKTTPTNVKIKLSVQGPARVTIGAQRTIDLRFAATLTSGGTPVQGLAVRFALQGGGAGSSLSTATAKTDDNGIVNVRFTSGNTAATTRVVASAENASNASVEVVIDAAATGVVGNYEFSMSVSPLDLMGESNPNYALAYNIVNVLINPVDAVLNKWRKYDEATHTSPIDKDIAICYDAGAFGSAACSVGAAAAPAIIKWLLGYDDSGTASAIYNALFSVGNLLKTVDVAGVLNIKTYDQNTKKFTAALDFDTYRLLWTARPDCINATVNDSCCGHTLFDAKTAGMQPFVRACTGTPATSATSPCAELTGTLTPQSANNQRYNITLDQASLSIAYGTLLKGALEFAVLPGALPASYPRETNGSVTLNNAAAGLLDCANLPSDPDDSWAETAGKRAVCEVAKAGISALLSVAFNKLDNFGQSDTVAKVSIASGQLIDTNADGQPDQLTAVVNVAAAAAGTSGTQTPSINGVRSEKICTGDAECGTGMVCRFARHTIDGCFARNQCGAPTGVKKGSDACNSNGECASGTCIAQAGSFTSTHLNTCFQACANNPDCGGNGTCDLDGYVSSDGGGALKTGTCVR